jgi:hypothetical protein
MNLTLFRAIIVGACFALVTASPHTADLVLLDAAQAAQSAPARAGAKPATIRGRVTAADSGRPLRRIRITLSSVTSPTDGRPIVVSTNAQGVYELRDVPAGSYNLSAAGAGYLTLRYGQRRPEDTGRSIQVAAGELVERIDLALPRGGVMAGRIVDELREPFQGVAVTALSVRYQKGRREPFPGGFATTDDRGEFRIIGLAPGEYFLVASTREMWLDEKKQSLGYAATYYPGVAADRADLINLGIAEQRTNLDMTLAVSRTARVTGRLQRATGEPIADASVSMAQTFGQAGFVLAAGILPARTDRTGMFEFRNVPPAEYRLTGGAGRGLAGEGESAALYVSVTGADIEGLLLSTRTTSSITGRVVTDEGAPPPFQVSGVSVTLDPPEAFKAMPSFRVFTVNPDWTFSLTNIGGLFLFRLAGLPADWMLHAVKLNDEDFTEVPFDVPSGNKQIPGLQIVVTQKVGRISGELHDAEGRPTPEGTVVVFAENPDLWTPGTRFIRSTRPASDGRFSLSGLPAGRYLAIAREFIPAGQWENREFLESVFQTGTRFTLDEGGSATLVVRLPAAR